MGIVNINRAIFRKMFKVAHYPILPALHPRMANEQYGPTIVRQLEPPGFLGLHYGWRTPLSVLLAHAIFGAILGAFYVIK